MADNEVLDSIKSYFSQSHFTSVNNLMNRREMLEYERDQKIKEAFFFHSLFILTIMVAILVSGFLAVPHLCPDSSERGKNTRLGLYFLLLVTGGQIGWLYILLWIVNINVCA
jgi:hypothetical protein